MFAAIKRFVPLPIKVKAHELNALRKENYVRLTNRLRGGLPIPPGELIYLVAANRRPDWFVASGVSSALTIREAAKRAGRPLESGAAYHPESYLREVLAKDFQVLEFVPCCSQGGSDQDAYLLMKPV